jgi:radical SAM superfamily enzyme with C-terminal helix-hairpin-helix motif
MGRIGNKVMIRNKDTFRVYKERMRDEVDMPMLRKVVPVGTILRRVRTETYEGKSTLARQIGTYPLLVEVPDAVPLNEWFDITVVDHGYRSVTGVPYPLNLNATTQRLIRCLPGISQKETLNLSKRLPLADLDQLRTILSKETYETVKNLVKV